MHPNMINHRSANPASAPTLVVTINSPEPTMLADIISPGPNCLRIPFQSEGGEVAWDISEEANGKRRAWKAFLFLSKRSSPAKDRLRPVAAFKNGTAHAAVSRDPPKQAPPSPPPSAPPLAKRKDRAFLVRARRRL